MTIAQKPIELMSKGFRDALVDQLRACKTPEEILKFESWFNSVNTTGSLDEVICDFLKSRSISRGLAAKWLLVLLKDRENRLRS